MKALRKFFPLLLATLLAAAVIAGALQAAAFYSGQWVGFGTVTGASARTVASGVTYDNLYVSGSSGGSQRLQTLTFNPKTGNYVPMVYTKYSGYGDTTYNSAVKAESLGYDVKGAVNASFFSFTGASCNTYGGVNISDGKVMQGSNSHGQTWMLAFDSDGSANLVWSKVTFAMTAKNGAWSAPVENVNICPETTYAGIYYYDEFCGSNTDTKAAGVEIVFEKQNGTQLTVGGTLEGKVVAVRSSTSSGGAIGANRFVLYASNSSSYASSLRGLAVGDTVKITATETVSGAKTVMENCSSAFVTYGYHIVSNGQNVTSTNGLGESFNTARAQRSAIGVKADGNDRARGVQRQDLVVCGPYRLRACRLPDFAGLRHGRESGRRRFHADDGGERLGQSGIGLFQLPQSGQQHPDCRASRHSRFRQKHAEFPAFAGERAGRHLCADGKHRLS